jgi:hypothetical protein
MMLERLGRSPWDFVMNAAILECLAAIEEPAAGRRKSRPSGALGIIFDPNNPPKGTA